MSDEPRVPRLHQSVASVLLARSPLYAWNWYNTRREPSEAMERGSLIDRLLLGDPKNDIVVVDPANFPNATKPFAIPDGWTNKAIQTERERLRGERKIPVLRKDYEEADAVALVLRKKIAAKGIDLSLCQSHVKVRWTSPDGVGCSGELDLLDLRDDYADIFDVKTAEDASDKAVTNALTSYGNDIQHAAYTEAIECIYPHLAGRVRFTFLFCELSPPDVRKVRLSGTMRALGAWKWSKAKKVWSECLKSGVWPGYADFEAEAKPWLLTEMMEEGEVMTFGGD